MFRLETNRVNKQKLPNQDIFYYGIHSPCPDERVALETVVWRRRRRTSARWRWPPAPPGGVHPGLTVESAETLHRLSPAESAAAQRR